MHMLRCCLTAAVLFPALFGTAVAQDAAGPVRPAKVFTVTGSDSEFRRTYPGIVLPSKEVELSFRVSGRVIELPIRASMRLEEGAVVAQLDQRDFEAQVAQLQSQKDEALARLEVLRTGARPEEIAVLEATVSAAEARLGQARDQFERSRQLAERGVTTTAKLREDESALRVAAAQFEAELEQLAIGRAGGRPEEIAAAEAALRGLDTRIESARDDLADTTLRAPFAGIVARRDIENFSNITSGQTVVLMQDISTVDVVFDIPGTDITAILATGAENVKSVVVFDAVPGRELEGEVVEFSTQADAATQTYRGRMSVKLPEDAVVLPGMVARIITTAPSDQQTVLEIPLSAIAVAPDGSSFVWRVEPADNSVSQQPVTLGEVSGGNVSVTDGLADGDIVVSAGVSQLQQGMQIRPITEVGG